jgi:putative sigma-54 modulation protein
MQISIVDKDIHLTDGQKNYIEEKIDHLKHLSERIDDESTRVRVDVETNRVKTSNRNITLQVTMFPPHAVIRAEVMSTTVEEGIDLAIEKLQKQIERYKGKSKQRDKSGKWIPSSTLEEISSTQEGAAEVFAISKRKTLSEMQPMHEEEAIEQMELLDHTFFAFMNSKTNKFNVVYRRNDGSYGLLELHQ